MKVVPPRYKSSTLTGAFQFDVETFDLLDRTMKGVIKQECSASYSLTMKNGSQYEVDSLAELEKLPLANVRSRDVFEAKWETLERPWAKISVRVRYWRPALIEISSSHEEHTDRLHQEVTQIIESKRHWYSWAFAHWVLPVIAAPLYSVLGLAVLVTTSDRRTITLFATFYFGYLALFVLFYFSRLYLFESVAMNIGSEAVRQLSLSKTRSYVFGTLIVGVVMVVLGAAAGSWFGN